MAKMKVNAIVHPDIMKHGHIRLCPFWWQPKCIRRWYVKVDCSFCGKAIMDRGDVRKNEPPPVCPDCQKIWYAALKV